MKRKKIMKIVLIILLVIVLIIAGFVVYKIQQLKKVNTMTVDEIIAYATKDPNTFISMAIIEDGNITYHTYTNGGEEVDRTDLEFEIGSISKTVAALLTAKAVSEGKINLTDSISKYLDLPAGRYYPTIDRLLTHTSGYKSYYFESEMISNHLQGKNDFYRVSREKILDKVKTTTLEDKDYPFVYSNFGISVMGLVLEKVYQKDYTDLVNDYLHNELGLLNTDVASCTGNLTGYWDWAQNDGYIPAGAIISDIKDMAQYLYQYMYPVKDYTRMPFQILKTVNYSNFLYSSFGIRMDQLGMTWIYDSKDQVFWHNGGTSNYNSHIAISKYFTKGIVLLSNYGPDKGIPVTVIGARLMEHGDGGSVQK